MDLTPDTTYSWESLEEDTLVLPIELLAYYLCKYNYDQKAKKEAHEKEDLNLIYHYLDILEIEKEVDKNVFKISQ